MLRTFRLHVNYMQEPRHRIWTVTLYGTRAARRRTMYATQVFVDVPVHAIPGPRREQPRAFLEGQATHFRRGRTGCILITHEGERMAKHPGFKNVQNAIAAKQGVSKDRAGAILAASSRNASPAAKRANPRLSRVKG